MYLYRLIILFYKYKVGTLSFLSFLWIRIVFQTILRIQTGFLSIVSFSCTRIVLSDQFTYRYKALHVSFHRFLSFHLFEFVSSFRLFYEYNVTFHLSYRFLLHVSSYQIILRIQISYLSLFFSMYTYRLIRSFYVYISGTSCSFNLFYSYRLFILILFCIVSSYQSILCILTRHSIFHSLWLINFFLLELCFVWDVFCLSCFLCALFLVDLFFVLFFLVDLCFVWVVSYLSCFLFELCFIWVVFCVICFCLICFWFYLFLVDLCFVWVGLIWVVFCLSCVLFEMFYVWVVFVWVVLFELFFVS